MAMGIYAILPFSIADQATSEKYLLKYSRQAFSRINVFEFNDDGMHVRAGSGSYSFTTWSDLVFAQYKDEIARIYLSRQIAHLIPDNAWPSTTERDQFLALLRSKGLLK